MTDHIVRRGEAAEGPFALVITPKSAGWGYSSLRILELEAGGSATFATGEDEAIVLPLEGGCTVACDGQEFTLAAARATRRLEPRYGPAEGVSVELRGAGQSSRQVNNFCMPATFEADKLIAVEVLTPSSNWSSFPPHKHDEDREGESVLEEIYYFEVDNDGPGFQ